jgi:acyl-CoA oxidase
MEESPEKFFLAHRLLSTVGLGGFGIRFTVQFNLFAGSIVGLAGPEQRKMLSEIQEKGQLGCFLLTEMQAGVLSGLIVETTADWDSATQEFVLHTPSDKAAKNWISQGYTAELGVVIADLRVDGVSHGPHPFFLQLRDGEGANGAFGCVWLRLLGQLFWDLFSFVFFFSRCFPFFLSPFPFSPFHSFPTCLSRQVGR